MKTRARLVVLLVVLGFCLPSYGEILVYKFMQKGTFYIQEGGQWDVEKYTGKGYLVLDVNYVDSTITQAGIIEYGIDHGVKEYEGMPLELELVRVEAGGKVQWIVMAKEAEGDSLGFHSLVGLARSRPIGTATKQEAANKLSGYGLEDQTEGGTRDIGISTLSATLYPAWTNWANGTGVGQGNQDFAATTTMIEGYLVDKGYVEETD